MKTSQDLHCYTRDTFTRDPIRSGPLTGYNFALKDLCAVKGHVSSFGHPRWRETHKKATEDSYVVRRLLENGARMHGIAKMDQYAFSLIGNISEGEAPVNTKYPERFCGGSSSGSASAVAGNIVDFAVGTDTAGSVRIPAAVCGIYGIRTSHGLIDKSGVIPLAKSFDTIGFFASQPHILNEVTNIFLPETKPKKFKKILIPKEFGDSTSGEFAKAIKSKAEELAKVSDLTLEMKEVEYFISWEASEILRDNQSYEIGRDHKEWVTKNKQFLSDDVRDRIEFCVNIASQNKIAAKEDRQKRKIYTEKLVDMIGDDSVLCLPLVSEAGPNIHWDEEKLSSFRKQTFRLVAPASLSGLPQISAPIKDAATNIGIIGPKGSDLELIRLFIS